ncbi:hypothetical protein KY290_027558 [Solanum tuberosum]|uniref:RNase H type-1 domain-containing protein n=1 Tax=Solanum tuberosum TaxID=4113 RepID=A0ABQ7UH89_SOLTU|nr:hypothetical protein KY285_026498 [Solanum tuberosum]KAH0748326.1 hypothetical protein KY290_027558 [Solanum tuberosum]
MVQFLAQKISGVYSLEQNIWWKLKGGSVAIWYDNWIRLGPLFKQQPETTTCYPLTGIELLMNEDGWNYELMKEQLPECIVEHVKCHMDQVRQTTMGDKPWWMKTNAAGIIGPWIQLKQAMKKWWEAQGNSRQKLIFQAIPNIVLWFFGRGEVQFFMVECILMKFGYTDVPKAWPHMIALLDGYKPTLQYEVVRWSRLPISWWKCNTDGASRGNSGPSSASICVRNSDGNLVGAKGLKVGVTTNLIAEVVAVKEGLSYCCENNFLNVIIETDSMALVQILNGAWEVLWSVTMEVNSILRLKEVHLNISHSRRFQFKAR